MKKLIVLLLTSSMLFTLFACSKPEEKKSSLNEATVGEPLAEQETPSVSDLAEQEQVSDEAVSNSLDAKAAGKDFVGERLEKVDYNGQEVTPAIDFALRDQNGNYHSLKEYEGKVIVLNFWQTWCGPCRAELPDFQKVYADSGENQGDVVILGVSSPANDQQTYRQEGMTDQEIKQLMTDEGLNYPTLMDYTGDLYAKYGIMAFPTSIFITPEGHVCGIVPGSLSEANLLKNIELCKGKVSE